MPSEPENEQANRQGKKSVQAHVPSDLLRARAASGRRFRPEVKLNICQLRDPRLPPPLTPFVPAPQLRARNHTTLKSPELMTSASFRSSHCGTQGAVGDRSAAMHRADSHGVRAPSAPRSEEHTSELQSHSFIS